MLVDIFSAESDDLATRLDEIDDDTPAFGEVVRVMLWDAYTQAGQPLGPEEDAMLAWWGFGQGTTVQ